FSFFHRPSAQAISSPRRLSMQMSSSSARAKDQSRGSHNVVGFFRSLAKSSFSALMKCSWSASVHTGPFSLIHFFPISTHLLSARERCAFTLARRRPRLTMVAVGREARRGGLWRYSCVTWVESQVTWRLPVEADLSLISITLVAAEVCERSPDPLTERFRSTPRTCGCFRGILGLR